MNAVPERPARLYLVATPLGNLQDITWRAVDVLRQVQVVACEDTRHSRRLLDQHGISAKLISCHEHNEEAAARQVVALLQSGVAVALVTDAGTPGISDPGYRVVRLALDQGLTVVPVPGPSAVVTALSASGLPTDSFYFGGFLPQKSAAGEKILAGLRELPATLIFYCPARRVVAALETARRALGDRQAVVARELTKLHEEFVRGSLDQVRAELAGREQLRGEIVLLIEGWRAERQPAAEDEETLERRVEQVLEGLGEEAPRGAKAFTALAAERLGLPRNLVYPLVCRYLNRQQERR